jgi:hypothetical protein
MTWYSAFIYAEWLRDYCRLYTMQCHLSTVVTSTLESLWYAE